VFLISFIVSLLKCFNCDRRRDSNPLPLRRYRGQDIDDKHWPLVGGATDAGCCGTEFLEQLARQRPLGEKLQRPQVVWVLHVVCVLDYAREHVLRLLVQHARPLL